MNRSPKIKAERFEGFVKNEQKPAKRKLNARGKLGVVALSVLTVASPQILRLLGSWIDSYPSSQAERQFTEEAFEGYTFPTRNFGVIYRPNEAQDFGPRVRHTPENLQSVDYGTSRRNVSNFIVNRFVAIIKPLKVNGFYVFDYSSQKAGHNFKLPETPQDLASNLEYISPEWMNQPLSDNPNKMYAQQVCPIGEADQMRQFDRIDAHYNINTGQFIDEKGDIVGEVVVAATEEGLFEYLEDEYGLSPESCDQPA